MKMIEFNWNPDRRMLRQFGGLGFVFFGGLGAWLAYRHGLGWLPIALGGLSLFCGVSALAAPAALRPLFVGLSIVTVPIGFVVSHVLLGVVYFGLFTPVRLIQALIGRDALSRRFDRAAKTYWSPRETDVSPARYYRQS
jgi:hypothetical protein